MKLRAFTFLLLFSTQAIASGVMGVLHLCSQAEAMDSCACPHGKEADAPLSWRAVDCCEVQALNADRAPATPDTVRAAGGQLPMPAVAPNWMMPVAVESLPAPVFAWHVAPPGQGPPIFLKVQSLLN